MPSTTHIRATARALTLLAATVFLLTGCAPTIDPPAAEELIRSSEVFRAPWIYTLRLGEQSLSAEMSDELEQLFKREILRVADLDEERGRVRLELGDSGVEASAGWVAVERADDGTVVEWEIAVAERLLLGVEGRGQEVELVWTWIVRDDDWEELAGFEDLALQRFRTVAAVRSEGDGWVLDEESLAAGLADASPQGSLGEEPTGELVEMLASEDPARRVTGAISLGILGTSDPAALRGLAEALDDPDVRLRYKSARALWRLKEGAAPAAAELGAAMVDPDVRVRHNAYGALRVLGPEAEPAIPTLLRMLDEGDVEARIQAVNVLEEIGEPAAVAVPRIAELLSSTDDDMRYQAADALEELAPFAEAALPALIRALTTDEDPDVRRNVVSCLGDMGPPAAPAIPAMIEATRDSEPLIRDMAVSALGRMGQAAAEAVPALIAALDDDEPDVRVSAAEALGKDLGGDPQTVEQALDQAMSDDDARVRFAARRSLDTNRARAR